MLASPPLDPSSDQARQWLERELSKSKYGDRHHLLERFLKWLVDQFGGAADKSAAFSPAVLVIVLALLALLIGFGLTRIRRDRPTTTSTEDAGVFEESVRSARQLREQARRARDAGDLDTAYLAWFRAIARSGVERVLVPQRAGSTAHEVALQLADSFAAQRDSLATVAATFDRIRYGNGHADAADVGHIDQLDHTLRHSRPAPSQVFS